MADAQVSRAVEDFARRCIELPDAALERDWPWREREVDVRWGFYRVYEELRDLAATIEDDRAAHGPRQTAAQRALAVYQVAYRDLKALLLGVGDDEVDRAPAEGEWPLRDVLQHMMRTERGFLAVTFHALSRHRNGQPPQQTPPEAYEPYRGAGDGQGTLAEIMTGYDALHERVLSELTGLSDDDLQAPVSWWYEADVRFQLYRFDAHLREHTIQVEKVLEAIRPRPADAHRTLRLIYRALGAVEGALLGAPDSVVDRSRQVAAAIAGRTDELVAVASAG